MTLVAGILIAAAILPPLAALTYAILTSNCSRKVQYFGVGMLPIIVAVFPLLWTYAWSRIVPPDIHGWEWWSEVLKRMFSVPDTAVWFALVAIGVGIMVYGIATPERRVRT
jgi:hypothetical protein